MGEPDELAQYNAYLNKLQERNLQRGIKEGEKP
jgi:hypothetical protein